MGQLPYKVLNSGFDIWENRPGGKPKAKRLGLIKKNLKEVPTYVGMHKAGEKDESSAKRIIWTNSIANRQLEMQADLPVMHI